MKNGFLPIVMVFGILFTLYSCGDNIDCEDTIALNSEAETNINNIFSTQDAFDLDPSDDNCKALKQAVEDYIDFLNNYEECVNADEMDEFNMTLTEAEAFVDTLDC